MIVFDLDGTLAPSKLPMTREMADLVSQLLEKHQVCVISGASFRRFQEQFLDRFRVEATNYPNIFLMPTNGTSFYRFEHGAWQLVYKEELPAEDRKRIEEVLTEGVHELDLTPEKSWGQLVEDRGSQVTYSGLGQDAPLEEKLKWDPNHEKRERLRLYASERLPGFEATVAGTTSVDVTREGKAHGVNKLLELLDLRKEDILFVGDSMESGGNDYPVKAAGYESIAVKDDKDCEQVIKHLLDTK